MNDIADTKRDEADPLLSKSVQYFGQILLLLGLVVLCFAGGASKASSTEKAHTVRFVMYLCGFGTLVLLLGYNGLVDQLATV